MHPEAVSAKTRRVLEKIRQSGLGRDFYLAGGTALAIQLGHRESLDLDWFSASDFSNSKIKEELASLGKFELKSEEEGTIHGLLDGVRVSFLRYKYNLLFPFVDFEGVNLAEERDILAMKLDAISARGSKKDFVDLYFLMEKYTLEELIGFFEKKFSSMKFNRLHLLKSLAYFEDADAEPAPIMLKKFDWEKEKSQIKKKVSDYLEKQIA